LGTNGSIWIYENNVVKAAIDITNPQGKILINGSVLEILGQNFAAGSKVHFLIPNGVIQDLAGNSFLGIVLPEQWTFTISNPSSVEELEYKDWLLFPNPAGEMVFIRSNSSMQPIQKIRLFDLTGKEIETDVYGNSEIVSINLEQLKQGVYVLEIETLMGKKIRKELIH
jgi:hypothetical protein